MHHFTEINGELYCESVAIEEIAAQVGTPFYLYSHATLLQHFHAFDGAFDGVPHITCFSMKSNSNMAILRLFGREGGGVDIVSGGELYRALKAGIEPQRIVYSGVGKSREELFYALKSDILMFNVESSQELHMLDEVGKELGKKAPVAIRINPDVDPQTHPYISTGLKENKFGIDIRKSVEEYTVAAGLQYVDVAGLSCHIGSQLTKVSPFVDALKRLNGLIEELENAGVSIRYLDLGGGLGITYDEELPPSPKIYADALRQELRKRDMTLILEPGRVIMGNAGILVTRVLYTKLSEKNFIIVDAAMNDLMRPSLYGSYHRIVSVKQAGDNTIKADVVGPICESGDYLAKDREMPLFKQGDLMAVMSAGAYGFSMSSTYNSRPRVAEVMVKEGDFYIIRERETYEDLIRGEKIPPFLNEK